MPAMAGLQAEQDKLDVGSSDPAPVVGPADAGRRLPAEGRAKYSQADVQRVYEKYGGSGCAIPGRLAAFLETSRARGTARPAAGKPGGQAPVSQAGELSGTSKKSAPPSIGLQLLQRLVGELDGVATPFGIGTVMEGETLDSGHIMVQFPWGRAQLRADCVDRAREAVLQQQLQSLSSLFGVLVAGLPRLARRGACLEASSVSSEESDDGLEPIGPPTSPSSYDGRPSASVKSLASWLEEASLRPLPSQRGEIMDVAVVLSSLVRSRTEFLRLKGMSSNPQMEAELLAADAVRIHLGLLERLDTAPEKKTSRLTETCKQWRQVLEQLSADSGLSSGANRLTAWKMVRPGAKPADPRDEIRTASSAGLPTSASTYTLFRPAVFDGMVTSQVTAGPILRGPARQVFTQTTQHRSPSPMVTRTVWPPMLVGTPQLRVSSSTAMLRTAAPGPGTAVPGPGAPVPGPAVPGPASGSVTRFVSTAAVPRSVTPLMSRSASTRWTSPIQRASTPIPRQHFGPAGVRGLDRPVEVATTRAAPCVSPMPSRGREYRSVMSSPYTSDFFTSPQHHTPAVASVSPGIHMLSPQAQSMEAGMWMSQLGPPPVSQPSSAPRLVATGSLQATPDPSSGYAPYQAQSLPSPGLGLASQARLGEVDERSPGAFADTLRMLDFMSGSLGTSLTRLFSEEDLPTGEDKGEESTERQSQDPQDAPEEEEEEEDEEKEALRPSAVPKRGLKGKDSGRGGRGTTMNTPKSKAGKGRGKSTASETAAFVRPRSKSRQTSSGTAQGSSDANRRTSPGRRFQISSTDDNDRRDDELEHEGRVEADELLSSTLSKAAGGARGSGREGEPMRRRWR
eukprot:TRINITY_DN14324_c0_g4_i1.p1 TRINITY_DN14324_c0_g4~~TRINITY_DN14324_c0_g4_i1.p1  ORF type:complete len:850 (-),score=144.09 TRINITY_DN14324_c0_g4_i1:98-2647(-)